MSAWELAFGKAACEEEMQTNPTIVHPAADDNVFKVEAELKPDTRRSWFSWSSTSTVQTSNGNFTEEESETVTLRKFKKRSALNIAPSKLEGIKHAFTAEALRAIGSDEASRLQELLDSGLDSDMSGPRLEVAGKDFLRWCIDMGAVNCEELLRARYNVAETITENGKSQSNQELDVEANATSHCFLSVPGVITPVSLKSLHTRLEESESLCGALSSILDNVAEEVSVTQELLYYHGSNSALISQVRSLKSLRTRKDEEIAEWRRTLKDRNAELEMVMMWWKSNGGREEDIPLIPFMDGPYENTVVEKSYISECGDDNVGIGSNDRLMAELAAQLTLSESKVRKLRASISDLAAENARNLQEIENELWVIKSTDGATGGRKPAASCTRSRRGALENGFERSGKVRILRRIALHSLLPWLFSQATRKA